MVDNARLYQIEHFYAAITGQSASQPGRLQVLAQSTGIHPEQVVECQKMVYLAPPSLPGPALTSSVGLFRGDSIDYVIAKVQAGSGGTLYAHYLLVPSAALRRLGGNLHGLETFGLEPMPEFRLDQGDLMPYMILPLEPPDRETQTDDLLALMGYCKNNLRNLGGLLAGLVQAMGLAIINAPPSLKHRLTFIQGLLTLLPIPARTAVTFSAGGAHPTLTRTQIKFLETDTRIPRHLTFDWSTGKLLEDAPEDTYSKYILTQLRLDTSLVVEQTEKLARTAVWRAMKKDDMANALAWVSKRASLDSVIENNQPADRAMVAAVLREDPTLPDDLRMAYARHLISFALALNDPSETEIVPAIAAQNQDLAGAIYDQLQTAAISDQAASAYKLVKLWVLHPPMGIDVSRWRPLLALAAQTRYRELANGPIAPLVAFMEDFVNAPPALDLERTIVQLLGQCYKRSYDNLDMARVVFLLAVAYLPIGNLQRLLNDPQLTAQLPTPLRIAFPHLMPMPDRTQIPSLLAKAADVYGPEWQPLILGRLIEWAFLVERVDLMDTDALSGLIKVAMSPQGNRFDSMIQNIVQDLSRLNILRDLSAPIQQHLINLSLARGRYNEALAQLVFYQEQLYKPTEQEKVAAILRGTFRQTPIDVRILLGVLDMLQTSPLRPLMRIYAHIGALEGQNWNATMEPAARRLTAILFADPRLISLIGVEPILRLLQMQADRHDVGEARRTAGALIDYATTLVDQKPGADQSAELIARVYGLINWDAEIGKTSLELLHIYIRRASLESAKTLIQLIGERYGTDKQRVLEAVYALRLTLGGTDFSDFAEKVQIAADLLVDMAKVYQRTDIPLIFQLRRTIEAVPGGLSEVERLRLTDNLVRIDEQLWRLYQLNLQRKSRVTDTQRIRLVRGETAPGSAIEAFLWFGGHFGDGSQYALQLESETPPFLLGSRSQNILLRESDLIVSLFGGVLAAFPEKPTGEIDPTAWTAEVNSVWEMLPLFKQRELHPKLAENAQVLGLVLILIGEKGNDRSLQATGNGRQLQIGKAQPRSVMDALRWLSGYFGHEHEA